MKNAILPPLGSILPQLLLSQGEESLFQFSSNRGDQYLPPNFSHNLKLRWLKSLSHMLQQELFVF